MGKYEISAQKAERGAEIAEQENNEKQAASWRRLAIAFREADKVFE